MFDASQRGGGLGLVGLLTVRSIKTEENYANSKA